MALTAYTRTRILWGALDVTTDHPSYSTAQTKLAGPNANLTEGVAGRKAQLVFSRPLPSTFSEDVAVMHFDFVNYTGGEPDDTWIASDFTGLETIISTWWTAVGAFVTTGTKLHEIRWYRVGSGIGPPNPPVRVTTLDTAATGGTSGLPPQCAFSITLQVAPRKSWGRTYLPSLTPGSISGSGGMISAGRVDTVVNATATLLTSAAAADMQLCVFSRALNSMLAVEKISGDDIVDIQRRRRWEHPTYRKQVP